MYLLWGGYSVDGNRHMCEKKRIIVNTNRTLSPAGSNYSVIHQETLAVVWALKHFKDNTNFGYIIPVYTDHGEVT